ncbi:isocitrate/isopropylmalate dehydrogenase family protein [Mycolicibacterium sp. CH28]|uniref:isocitrate/isopropylmalate dehydrogenase family protein n=1 Tax=Mycolicibacterium sp. CH28 TaxID=2512237 RepID=UPI00108127A4|nr:isocitrate/isopropylmalate family dehydrogenase [Mycolicibacterium sp. CH28]TGD89763.1 isocitrate/isopropylmalate dehydrogenase family protein [Mycolicibacterium sp. CH28]
MNSALLQLAVLPGDGIGPEVVSAAQAVTAAALHMIGTDVEWTELPMGERAIATHGDPLPDQTLLALDRFDAWLLGPHDNAGYPAQFGGLSPGGRIRKRYDMYANIRPAAAVAAGALCPDLDVVIVRENTEGFYADRNMFDGAGEFMPTPDVALAVAVFTRAACERIAHTALRIASTRRRHLTIVHKANVLAKTTGLFRDSCLAVAEQYPEVVVRSAHVDALAARLISHSSDFDVIVAENMFGDILSDLTAQLAGSLGLAPSINVSETKAMAQAVHGAAPDIAGTDTANPVAMMRSSAMLLRWLADARQDRSLERAAELVDAAISKTLGAGTRTADLGGDCGTAEFTQRVVAALG